MSNVETTTRKPPEVRVPAVEGLDPTSAVADLRAAGFKPHVLDPSTDPELCKVRRQSERGRVPRGWNVYLHLRCEVRAPNVVGLSVAAAQRDIGRAGRLKLAYRPFEPAEPEGCTVTEQSERGVVAPGTRITLTLTCEITLDDVRTSATDLARDVALKEGGDYEVTGCHVYSSTEGECDVRYFDLPGALEECSLQIVVTLENSETLHAEEANEDCY